MTREEAMKILEGMPMNKVLAEYEYQIWMKAKKPYDYDYQENIQMIRWIREYIYEKVK